MTTADTLRRELPKSYTPQEAEGVVRARWEDANAFHADPGRDGPTFSIVIPPPNVTAALHLGHAFNNTLQDVLVRYHRMRGCNTMWMPGTDHAGIATQTVVEKRLLAQGRKRTDMARDEFVAMVQEWKDEYEATITEQLKAMGCSCDWDRQRFTMDEVCARAVREAFFRLFRDELIYRGKRLVNWDPVTLTALADDEVDMKEVAGHMWYLRYPLEDGSGHVTVATTRPETMLGDTAVAVNPSDPHRRALKGKRVVLPIVGRVIPILEDDYVVLSKDMGGDPADTKAEYATGFLKVTPAHDPNDWDIGQRHQLPVINVMAPDGSISATHGWEDVSDDARAFVGKSREDARAAIVEWFKQHDLLDNVREYSHSVGHSYRSHVPIEPYLSDQWYVKVSDDRLVGEAARAQADEQYDGSKPKRQSAQSNDGDDVLRFHPARYAKMYQSWHDGLRDWCVSRQLWWGHRIPVWHKRVELTETNFVDELMPWGWDEWCEGRWAKDGIEVQILRSADRTRVDPATDPLNPVVKATEGEYDIYVCCLDDERGRAFESHGFTRDPDVLDTWFSSALWPISTMGWPRPADFPDDIPEGDALLETFNPSTVLCTGRDIITLWVSRMVMFNRFFRDGTLPFEHVYINPMIQDGHGQRMSKSLGNGVDPRDIIHSHGADALRFALVQMATSTQDCRMPVDTMCPHCSETFHPKEITSPAGYRVAAPTQKCPKCAKTMKTLYGAASGVPDDAGDDLPQARNTSRKFDLGRNFANKLWNATRFALSNLTEADVEPPPIETWATSLTLADRWIITRLHRTLHSVEDALRDYQFSAYANAMYDFVWREFCDWYLEAIKPTVRTNPAQQQVLRTVLSATMRLLHPICPFVTEALWPSVQAAGHAGLDGIELPPAEMLATASWPDIACVVDDDLADTTFERARRLVEAIRVIRSERNVLPKRAIRLAAPPEVISLVEQAAGMVQTLANLAEVEPIGDRPADATPFTFDGEEVIVFDLVDAMDADAERQRLEKDVASLKKAVANLSGRLNNEAYVSKAPPKLVDETRQQLEEKQASLAAAQRALDALSAS